MHDEASNLFLLMPKVFWIAHMLGPTSGGVVVLKIGRREVPGSNPGRACRPRRSVFSVIFSETRVNTG